jgi:acyl carrier protein
VPAKPVAVAATAIAETKVAVAKVAAVAPAPFAPPQPSRGDAVKERVLALVAEKTGYPVDMLDLDLDLEADLGVDTVKQAEVFAAVREAYGIVRDDKIKLRDFPTLAHVIGFVLERCPELAPTAPAVKIKEKVETSAPPLATVVIPAMVPSGVFVTSPAAPRSSAKAQRRRCSSGGNDGSVLFSMRLS